MMDRSAEKKSSHLRLNLLKKELQHQRKTWKTCKCIGISIQFVVSPRTAEDLYKASDDDEEAESQNSTRVIKHHLGNQ